MTAMQKLIEAERLLNEYLVDNTEEVFEELPQIDDARTLLLDAIEELTAQKPVAVTITSKFGNIYSFTGDYSLKKGDKVYITPPAPAQFFGFEIVVDETMPPDELRLVQSPPAPAQPCVGLTDEEFVELCSADLGTAALIRAVEAKLKEKNSERQG